MKIKSSFRAGFTLTEIILSVALLALVWVAAAGAVVMSKGNSSLAKHKSQAMYVIAQTMENIRKTPYASIVNGSTTTTVHVDRKDTPDVTTDDFNGTQVVTVTTPVTHYKQIIVELRWNEVFFGRTKIMREYCGTFISDDPQSN